MKNKSVLSVFLFLLGILFLPRTVMAADVCDYTHAEASNLETKFIDINYSAGTAKAKITNKSNVCAFNVGMSSYKIPENGMPMAGLNNQTRFDHTSTKKLDTGESVELTVSLPKDCRSQIDVYIGESVAKFNYPNGTAGVDWYGPRLLKSDINEDQPFCKEKPEEPEEPKEPEKPKDTPKGEVKVKNVSLDIEKEVRIEGNETWREKVTDVKKDDVIEFKIKIKNTGNTTVDNLKMTDELPKELERVGGSGLTEYFGSLEPGKSKTFTVKAKVKDENMNEEKCVVNKANVKKGDDKKAEDSATVCYGDVEITELPETGAGSSIAFGLFGLASMFAGSKVRSFYLG